MPGIQRDRVVASCICDIFNSWSDGNGKDDASGSFLLGICADECTFRASLGHDPWNVKEADRRRGKTACCHMDCTGSGSADSGVWAVSLWQKEYHFLYVP